MKTYIKRLIIACTTVLCFSCIEFEDIIESDNTLGIDVTITAVREGFAPDTKTIRLPDGSVEWCPMDEISVFYGNGTNGGSKFTSQNTEQTAVAEFKGRLEGISAGGENFTEGKYLYGVYPYSNDTKFNDDTVTISLPSYQTAIEGTFSNGLFPTIARAQGFNLAFYNICGGVKFTVSREDITSVTFKGNNEEKLAGTARIIFDSYEKPAVVDDEGNGSKNEITVYAPAGGTFEVGKDYYIVAYPAALNSGFTMTLRTSSMQEGTFTNNSPVEIKRSVFGVLNNVDQNISSWTDVSSIGGGNNSGIYLGIMGFNQQLYSYPISELTEGNKTGFNSFIDDLNTKNGTLLYYSVDKTITSMQSVPLPTDISTVAIVTFTDGLDQGSIMMNDSYSSNYEYLNALNNRIMNETVSGQPITAYSIGIRGQDVADVSTFQDNLRKLASKDEYATEVSSMAEVNEKFKEIAEKLSTSNYVQTITLKMPGLPNGTLVRFTFDNVKSAEDSELYIEGTFNLSKRSLENVRYKGLESTSGTEISGIVDGIFVSFTFEGVHTDNNKLIDNQFIDEWTYVASNNIWQINSEFDKTENSDIITERSSAAIMLVLDCSSSLGSDFPKAQTNAKDFINTLYEAVGEDNGSGEDHDNTIYSTTPKDLSLAISKDGTRYYLSKEEYDKANLSNSVIEGLCVVSGTDEPFIIALRNASSSSMIWKYADLLYDLPTYKQGVVICARWTDINNALKTFGGNSFGYPTWTGEKNDKNQSLSIMCSYNGDIYLGYTTYDCYVRQVVLNQDLTIPWHHTHENDLTLAVSNGENRLFIDKNEYALSGIPSGYSIEGLAICSRIGNFILALKNESSDDMPYSSATQLYGEDKLPTYDQAIVICAKYKDINNALVAFGGKALSYTWIGKQYYYINFSSGYASIWSTDRYDDNYVRLVIDTF